MSKSPLSEAIDLSLARTGAQKRVARAVEHVRKLWMPINRTVFERVKASLNRGAYDNNREELIRELHSDMALFTWCLRGLSELAKQEQRTHAGFDPMAYLHSVDLTELKRILDVDPSDITNHDLEHSDNLQAQLLRDVILGASAAEVLSEREGKDSDRAFGAALLRQIGLTLVSWNYPSVVQEAVAAVKEGGELEVEISKRLGFSPSLLALELVREWGVSTKKCFSLGLCVTAEDITAAESEEGTEEPLDADSYLREVLELGENLAKVNSLDSYPKMRGRWSEIEEQIKEVLGQPGLARIRERFEENFHEYSRALTSTPALTGPIFNKQKIPASPEALRVLKRNKFIDDCELSVKHKLKRIYDEIDRAKSIDRRLVRVLLDDIVEAARFTAGCIYTHDPALSKLVPQLKIGVPQGIKAEPKDCRMGSPDAPLIVSAFQSVTPLSESVTVPGETTLLCVAGPFGRRARFGVLYLELPERSLSEKQRTEVITHFQAISRALNDCLNL